MTAEYDKTHNENTLREIESIQEEIEAINRHRAKGCMIRSKARWVEEGEKNTAYFLSLEKRNYDNKNISHLQLSDKSII